VDAHASAALDGGYRLWSHLWARRARRLPRMEARTRVEHAFRGLCADVAPALSLEIGAREARFSRWLRAVAPHAHCLAFEANPFVHEQYAAGLAEAGVDYRHLAITDVEGTVDLRIPREFYNPEHDRRFSKDRTSGMASLVDHRMAEVHDEVPVPGMRLDDVVRRDTDLDEGDEVVVWIDVEGASEQVLTSGAEVLRRAALVYIEVESQPVWEGQWLDVDVARFLAGCGLVPLLRDVQRPRQYNVVYVRADLGARPRLVRLCEVTYRSGG
jgi:FkbM family methyltransferase